jgi:hypothetical protein
MFEFLLLFISIFQYFKCFILFWNFGIFIFLEFLLFFWDYEFLTNNWIMHKDYLKFIDAYY